MKKNEIALLVLIVGIVGLASYFIVKAVVGGGDPKVESVEKATVLSGTVIPAGASTALNKDVFSEANYNPTIKIRIGDQSNEQPFNASQR